MPRALAAATIALIAAVVVILAITAVWLPQTLLLALLLGRRSTA